MTSPERNLVKGLFQQVLPPQTLQELCDEHGNPGSRRGIYAATVVLWLMMLQRLDAVGTLAAAVQMLRNGAAQGLLPKCRRARSKRISPATGGYCRARQKLPTILCQQVSRTMLKELRGLLVPEAEGGMRKYLLDGTSLELEHSPELVRDYPPAENQHGVSHWPVVRMVAVHELESTLMEEPAYGPMYGPNAVSEQELATLVMDRLPQPGVILGDRNFGVLWVAYEADRRGLKVLLRLTKARAKKLAGGAITKPGDWRVVWKAQRWDGGKRRAVPAEAQVEGRLIAVRVGRGKSKYWLYLFTTLDWPIEKLASGYAERWEIETDLRSLKRTVRLYHVNVRSTEMLAKELLMACAAYNLVRAVMCLAARKARVDARQLSFAMVLNVVNYAWPQLIAARTQQQFQREFNSILRTAARCTLPNRYKQRAYPREQWRRPVGFPFRKGEK